MYEIKMTLPFNGYYVEGKLTLPVKAKSLIIFSHGYGRSVTMPNEHRLAVGFQQEGFGTLVFDTLDAQEELPDNSRGFELFGKGLIASTNWLHSHSEYRSLNLAYFGSGSGAATALKAAAEMGTAIKSVVCLSGKFERIQSYLPKVKSPTLLIAGELDFNLIADNRLALGRLKVPKRLAVIPGASHLFEEPDKLNEASRIAVSWFNKHLRQSRSTRTVS